MTIEEPTKTPTQEQAEPLPEFPIICDLCGDVNDCLTITVAKRKEPNTHHLSDFVPRWQCGQCGGWNHRGEAL